MPELQAGTQQLLFDICRPLPSKAQTPFLPCPLRGGSFLVLLGRHDDHICSPSII